MPGQVIGQINKKHTKLVINMNEAISAPSSGRIKQPTIKDKATPPKPLLYLPKKPR